MEHNLAAKTGVTKLFYFGPMFRQEKPQAGRFRQFHQFGVEVLGENSPLIDAEVIAMATEIYRRLGLDALEVRLNSVGCPVCRANYRQALLDHLTPRSGELCASCQRRLVQNPLRVLDCKSPVCQGITAEAPQLDQYLCEDCASHFAAVRRYLDAMGVVYMIDSRLVRGLDYYTKTVFEVVYQGLGAQNAVCGGGRYDGLVQQCGGPPTPGIGFAAGVERLIITLEKQGKLPELSGAPQVYLSVLGDAPKLKAFEIAQNLRAQGIRTELEYAGRSLKAQMKTADKLNAALVLILGEDELARETIVLRNMKKGEQREVPWRELVTVIQEELG